MNMPFRLIISIILILLFGRLIIFLFLNSLTQDGFVHLIKDNYKQSPIQGFSGFDGQVTGSDSELRSMFGAQLIIYQKLVYEQYRCGKKCRWQIDKIITNQTGFTLAAEGQEISVSDAAMFYSASSETFNINPRERVIQHIIPLNSYVTVYGNLNGGKLESYHSSQLNQKAYHVIDDLKLFIADSVNAILGKQLTAGILVMLLGLLLLFTNRSASSKKFTVPEVKI